MAEIDRWLAGINHDLALRDVVEATVGQRRRGADAMTTGAVEGAFAEVVAGLDELMSCSSVFACDREAVWWLDQQGCTRAAACTAQSCDGCRRYRARSACLGLWSVRDCDGISPRSNNSAQSGRFEGVGNRIRHPTSDRLARPATYIPTVAGPLHAKECTTNTPLSISPKVAATSKGNQPSAADLPRLRKRGTPRRRRHHRVEPRYPTHRRSD